MNLEDKVDNYLRMYIQKDIPITREQADEINEYKCELKNEIEELKDNIHAIMEAVCVIEHNIEKYEEIGEEHHFEYAQKKIWELKKYLIEILKGKSE